MGIEINIRVIQGFRVPYKKLFKVISKSKFQCNHIFDRKESKFCPQCGKEAKGYMDEQEEPLINIDFDELIENDRQLTEKLYLCQCSSNCELDEHDEDYIIGFESYNEDPTCPDHMLNYIKPISEEDILAEIKKYPVDIPYNKNSFGIYLLNEIY